MDEFEIRTYILNLINSNPKLIESKLKYEYKYLRQRKEYFEMKEYIDNFLNEINTDKFFVMPGLRGVGKTTILYQLYDYLINTKNIESTKVLYLDLERLKDEPNLNLLKFFDVFIKIINEKYQFTDEALFIFVDESQYDPNWASAGKIVFDENVNVFTIFTGSNALNLEMNADMARRSIKKEIYPLNFQEYLNIKYNLDFSYNMEETIYEMLFSPNTHKITKIEKAFQINIAQKLPNDLKKEWETFIQYGDLPFGLYKKHIDLIKETSEIKDRVIERDMLLIDSFNTKTITSALSLINIIAKQKPGTLSNNNLASNLDIDKNTVKNILEILEKTQLIFPIEAYGSTSKREKKSKEYYFLSTQIKASFFLMKGDVASNYKQYLGILLENYIASTLFKLIKQHGDSIEIYYDPKKGGVDFIIKDLTNKPVPIEVGIGKKNKKQIKSAIKKYNADIGIIISDKTDSIIKDENIIYIPYTTFSLI
ncbi:AAA family ATPase [Methanosphaera sp. ISO3-F5]|uniref:ATP-binding protein n=1 Tax=Methanosphaera sp. ISO3-F5 TaxID=1452353 RepID=UPI002B2581DA|nr:AAA family ATPase [Methanosphaera sp. ISO3-F5]WQH64780.1 AAA family ATPase [Methanosphaera sp. ISO3-F5]